jgi:putative SOS response-associated peptidase YedK
MPPEATMLLDNHNVAPTSAVPVLVAADGQVHVEVMQWGLVPSWSNDARAGAKMINARAETVTEKVSFRSLVRGNRCIIAMNGFYEWQREGSRPKVPHYVTRTDGALLLAAGLWSTSPVLDIGASFAMMTRESGDDLASIHHRSPVHFTAEMAIDWLRGSLDVACALDAPSQPALRHHEVSTDVNNVRNNRPDLVHPAVNEGPSDEGQPTLF